MQVKRNYAKSQFAVSIFDWPITIPCYELCCNNNYLTEELAKAGNRVINDNSCAINPPYLSTLDLDDFFPYFSVQ
ncbi:4249_t:CDS:2 [Cetraspora pellucida]|uniref:4249_t:CDS:1 n=1 Tax=Cetraspora pellucida TaxID=1433469 RepID=A0A9N9ATF1_9GLOM|nr:4249_t:CDS:2 [Cetraspora pellucida]